MSNISPTSQAGTGKPQMLEIGEFCSYCGFKDFLPFACSGCDGNFCAEHREKDLHKCPNTKAVAEKARENNRHPQARPAYSPVNPTSRSQERAQSKLQQQPLIKPKPQPISSSGQRLGGNAQSTSSGLNPSGVSALARLRGLFADRKSSRVQDNRTTQPAVKGAVMKAHEEAVKAANATKVAGDTKIPVVDRCHVVLRRPASRYTDPITKSEATRPAKAIDTFFSKKQRVGQVSDSVSTLLGASIKSLSVEGETLDPGLPISAVPPGKIIDAITS